MRREATLRSATRARNGLDKDNLPSAMLTVKPGQHLFAEQPNAVEHLLAFRSGWQKDAIELE
mgnify:CR=1 FL=1